MRAALERREAQRPTSLAARTPSAAILGNGDIAVGAMNGPLARSVREPRKLPGASRRSIPSFEGERKMGMRAFPGPKQRTGAAERWLMARRFLEYVATNSLHPPLEGK